MNHEEFVRRTKRVLRYERAGQLDEAVLRIRALLQDLVPAVKTGVNDWHHQQALSLLVDTLSSADRKVECQTAWNDLIEFNKDQLSYWETSLTTAAKHFQTWKDANFI